MCHSLPFLLSICAALGRSPGSGPVHMVYSQEKKGQVSGINSPLARRAVGVFSR